MKKGILFCCICIFIAWSCTKEEDSNETLVPKPAGKYLSEIRTTISPFTLGISAKLVEFVYDDNRYLKTVKFYISETQQMQRHFDLFYTSDGLLDHIEATYAASNVMIDERFTYEDKKLVKIEGYKIEDSKTTLIGKTEFKVDEVNNAVEIYPYDLKDGVLVKRAYHQKYSFNTKGNLVKYHYNIGQGGFFETMEDFMYDDRISPFANLDIPYYNIVSSYFALGECFSMNNVVRHNNYLHENGVSYEKPVFDTIIYKYEGKYPVETAEYSSYPGDPLELKSQYFFKYIEL
ncbi:MAG TPA: hypothetical protein VFG54_13985 [Prolixibacteraceae bacterium]|nr:hypothetical protein [Prolixibacteraceae bacterium]